MTFDYKVMIESNSGKRSSWIWQIWWPQWAPASAPSKSEFSMFWSTSNIVFLIIQQITVYHIITPLYSGIKTWSIYDDLLLFLYVYLTGCMNIKVPGQYACYMVSLSTTFQKDSPSEGAQCWYHQLIIGVY